MERRDFQLLILSSIVILSLAFTLQSCKYLSSITRPTGEPSSGEPSSVGQSSLSDPPRIIAFNANPPEIGEGGASVLAWQTNNASSISISGLGAQPPSGSQEVRPQKSTTYELIATNATGQAKKKVRVNVMYPLMGEIPPPKIITFKANPPQITEGSETTLIWETSGAPSILISGLGQASPSGSQIVRPQTSTTYELSVANSVGKANKKIKVTVKPKKVKK
jgi:hypothetical protein